MQGSGLDGLAEGVASILGELDALDELGVDVSVRNARSLHRSMTAGAGSFLDAFIAHDDPREQLRLNDELVAARQELSSILESAYHRRALAGRRSWLTDFR